MNVNLVTYSETFLELSWEWLKDKEIKKLTNTPSFTKTNQKKWFRSLSTRHDYKIWGIELNHKPIGVCGFKNITLQDCEYWGYIGDKTYWRQGIGSIVLEMLINRARNSNIGSIWLTVLKQNIPAIGLYKKFGFINEIQLDNRLIKMRLFL